MQKYRSLFFTICGVVFAALPVQALAATKFIDSQTETLIQTSSGLGSDDPRVVIANVIGIVLGFLAFVAVILILYAGFTWMTAAGNEDKISTAKNTLIAAVIGLLLILASWGITIFLFGNLECATGAATC